MIPTLVAFDLDDTLYKERDFVMSGYRAIASKLAEVNNAFNYDEMVHVMAHAPLNPFDSLAEYLLNRSIQQSLSHDYYIPWMVATYRNHFPDISADSAVSVIERLSEAGYKIGLITDGRTVTQTNKIKALGLDRLIPADNISISETIGGEKFERMMKLNPDVRHFIYVGDNPMKDFLWPNRLGWTTIQLIDNGRNVHSQQVSLPSDDYRPQYRIKSLDELPTLLATVQ